MLALIVGGAKSGKSIYGQDMALKHKCNDGNLYYIATMKPHGEEDLIRIENHIRQRQGYGFITIEKATNIGELHKELSSTDTIFIDSLTALVTNYMFNDGEFICNVKDRIIKEIVLLSNTCKNVVMISDYTFSDSIIYDDYTECFRKELGYLNVELAKISQVVIECAYGNLLIHKGRDVLRKNEKFI